MIDNRKHIVIVEAYEGYVEFLSDESEERKSSFGLGLALNEISDSLDCRVTILCWNKWYKYELKETFDPTPATRPVLKRDFETLFDPFESEKIETVLLPTIDPIYMKPLEEGGLSPRSYGIIDDSGLLFFLSYFLNSELQTLYKKDPFHAVILPMWGGIGYVSQMAKATYAHNVYNTPFIVVVTDKSANRQISNQEGFWTRKAIIRRQMEDVSLALADLVLCFGSKGEEISYEGRLPEAGPPIRTPRRIDTELLKLVEKAANMEYQRNNASLQFFLHEPQEPAFGVLSTLDAVIELRKNGMRLENPFISSGPTKVFPPMKPRSFDGYWASKGVVKELIRNKQWLWQAKYPAINNAYPVRIYPSFFDHLPNIWSELARGSFVVISQSAAQGLSTEDLPVNEILIEGEPDAKKISEKIINITRTRIDRLDQIRRDFCSYIVSSHRGDRRRGLLENTIQSLEKILRLNPNPQDLSRVSLMFLDRCETLHDIAQNDIMKTGIKEGNSTKTGTLSVVVGCYELGDVIREAVESIWASERLPDEVILIDDGSEDEKTLISIRELEDKSKNVNLPLTVIHQRNQGLASSRNVGLNVANGEFISFLDGDDLIEPEFYRIALNILKQCPRLGGVAAWAHLFGTGVEDGFWNAPQAELPFLFIQNSVIVPCMTRTALLRELGGYDARQRYSYEDWELSIRMLSSGWPIVTIPMHLTRYRIRRDSMLRTMTREQNHMMRELILTTHKETVSRFAVEIAMQLEDQIMQFVYPDPRIESNRLIRSFLKIRRLLSSVKQLTGMGTS